jgi:hypothetical protein
MRKYSKDDVLGALKREIGKSNKSAVAASLGVTPQFIHLILLGKRSIKSIALGLGYIRLPDAYIRAPKERKSNHGK